VRINHTEKLKSYYFFYYERNKILGFFYFLKIFFSCTQNVIHIGKADFSNHNPQINSVSISELITLHLDYFMSYCRFSELLSLLCADYMSPVLQNFVCLLAVSLFQRLC